MIRLLVLVFTFVATVFAQDSPRDGRTGPRPEDQRRNPPPPPSGGLRAHRVQSATSADGLTWTRDEGVRIESASVPCAINDGDKRVLIYFVQPPSEAGRPETVACAVSTDGLKFEQERAFQIEGLSTMKAVDPSILKDEDGRFRLYYLASDHRGDPARGPNPHRIHLAFSDDGIRFRETGSVFAYNDLVDPDVFRFKDRWFMYVFARHGTAIATSADGKRFTYERDMTPRDWGTTAPVLLPDGRLRLYAFEQRVPVANAVGSFLSSDGINWTAEPGDRLKAGAGEQITDPFVIPWRGGYKMYFKHSPAQARNAAGNGPPNQGTAGGPPSRTFDEANRRPGQPPNNFDPQSPPQNQNANGPWNNDVLAWRVSRDGAVEKVATFERAGVPTAARMPDGRLIVAHQHFPENDRENFDKVAVHFSSDDGKTWSGPQVIAVAGLPEGMRFPFDPTLVPLPDGRIRLYFTGNMQRRGTPKIHSAISNDGVNYTCEPGVRFEAEGRMTIDCAAALHQGVFHLFVPHNGAPPAPGQRATEPSGEGFGYHATSTDGLNFTRQPDVQIEGRRRWLGNAQSDGRQIIFFGTGEGFSTEPGNRPRGGIWMATSPDGQSWKLAPSPAVGGADPGAVQTRDGGWLVVATGPPVRRAAGREGSCENFPRPENLTPRRTFQPRE